MPPGSVGAPAGPSVTASPPAPDVDVDPRDEASTKHDEKRGYRQSRPRPAPGGLGSGPAAADVATAASTRVETARTGASEPLDSGFRPTSLQPLTELASTPRHAPASRPARRSGPGIARASHARRAGAPAIARPSAYPGWAGPGHPSASWIWFGAPGIPRAPGGHGAPASPRVARDRGRRAPGATGSAPNPAPARAAGRARSLAASKTRVFPPRGKMTRRPPAQNHA